MRSFHSSHPSAQLFGSVSLPWCWEPAPGRQKPGDCLMRHQRWETWAPRFDVPLPWSVNQRRRLSRWTERTADAVFPSLEWRFSSHIATFSEMFFNSDQLENMKWDLVLPSCCGSFPDLSRPTPGIFNVRYIMELFLHWSGSGNRWLEMYPSPWSVNSPVNYFSSHPKIDR